MGWPQVHRQVHACPRILAVPAYTIGDSIFSSFTTVESMKNHSKGAVVFRHFKGSPLGISVSFFCREFIREPDTDLRQRFGLDTQKIFFFPITENLKKNLKIEV